MRRAEVARSRAIEEVAEDLCSITDYIGAKAHIVWGAAQIPTE